MDDSIRQLLDSVYLRLPRQTGQDMTEGGRVTGMGDSTEDQIDRLRAQTADHMRQIDTRLQEARTSKGSWTEDEVEYWLHPALHLIFVTLASLNERLTNLEDYVVRAGEGASTHEVAYLTNQDRQDVEAAAASLRAEERLIRGLMDLTREVTPADRANIGMELIRFLDRFIGQENKLRAMEGKPPLPERDD